MGKGQFWKKRMAIHRSYDAFNRSYITTCFPCKKGLYSPDIRSELFANCMGRHWRVIMRRVKEKRQRISNTLQHIIDLGKTNAMLRHFHKCKSRCNKYFYRNSENSDVLQSIRCSEIIKFEVCDKYSDGRVFKFLINGKYYHIPSPLPLLGGKIYELSEDIFQKCSTLVDELKSGVRKEYSIGGRLNGVSKPIKVTNEDIFEKEENVITIILCKYGYKLVIMNSGNK